MSVYICHIFLLRKHGRWIAFEWLFSFSKRKINIIVWILIYWLEANTFSNTSQINDDVRGFDKQCRWLYCLVLQLSEIRSLLHSRLQLDVLIIFYKKKYIFCCGLPSFFISTFFVHLVWKEDKHLQQLWVNVRFTTYVNTNDNTG